MRLAVSAEETAAPAGGRWLLSAPAPTIAAWILELELSELAELAELEEQAAPWRSFLGPPFTQPLVGCRRTLVPHT
jgi:hypothetical protein